MNPIQGHDSSILSTSPTPTITATNSNPYMDMHPGVAYPSYPGSSNNLNNMWIPKPSSILNYPFSTPNSNCETTELNRTFGCENINYQKMNTMQKPDYESNPYQYMSPNIRHPNNYPAYNNYPYGPSQNAFHIMPPYTFNQSYLPDCRSFMPNLPVVDPMKARPGLAPSQSTQYRDPMLEHNYARPYSSQVKTDEPSSNHSATSHNDSNKPLANSTKRSYSSVVKEENSIKNEDNNTPNEFMVQKKRKTSTISRELLLKPMTLGFERKLHKHEIEGEERAKKSIFYSTKSGVKINNRQELGQYLKSHPELDLKSENFSFDSRVYLDLKNDNTSTTTREAHVNGTLELEDSFDDFIPKSINNSKTRQDKSLTDLSSVKSSTKQGKTSTPSKISQIPRSIISRHRKLIGKYFKKLTNDSKFYDGFASGSYRKKLPTLAKIQLPSLNTSSTSSHEALAMYGDILCVYEFIHTFSSLFNLNLPLKPSLDELTNLLNNGGCIDDYFCIIISILLKKILIFEKMANDVGINYFIDNIYSLKWNWLTISEFLKIFLFKKGQLILDFKMFPNSYYFKNLQELIISMKDKLIYSLKPSLKMFCLRFLIDQLMSTSQSANIINEFIENIAQSRRDKFHLDNRIRQLKNKSSGEIITNGIDALHQDISINENKLDESLSASNVIQTPSTNGVNLVPSEILGSQNDEIMDLDKERDNMKISIKDALFSLRALYLGSDRYGREYYLPKNTNFICVESRSTISSKGDSEKSQPADPKGEKPNFPEPTRLSHILGISEKMKKVLFPTGMDDQLNNIKFLTPISTLTTKPFLIASLLKETQALQNMLIQNPKFIKFVAEYDLTTFVDIYTRASIKYKKKAITFNEYDEGWWKIDNSSTISELIKCLNQRGFRENHLLKSLNRYEEFINNLKPDNEEISTMNIQEEPIAKNTKVTDTSKINSISIFETDANALVIQELKTISIKMDTYLSKIGIEHDIKLEEELKNHLLNNPLNLKEYISFLVTSFVSLCERKFDRSWLSKWNELLEIYTETASLYLLLQSLRMKIDPNSKLCHICEQIDNNTTVMECNNCLLTAHESCLSEPMRKYKKTKMICIDCLNETISKTTRICKICAIKTGKTVLCANCKECFHIKCIQTKITNKIDPVMCEICTNLLDVNKSKTKEIIPDFPNVNLAKHYNECSELLKKLQESKDYEPFRIPVSNDIPSYYEIIKQPMDFQTIEKKMLYRRYKKVHQFFNDIMLIFQNCRTFNEDNSKIGKSGFRLQKLFQKEWKKICASF